MVDSRYSTVITKFNDLYFIATYKNHTAIFSFLGHIVWGRDNRSGLEQNIEIIRYQNNKSAIELEPT